MADSTSKITPPDTTPASKDKGGDALDDWSSVLDSLGSIQQADEAGSNEAVGDLSALDEAIAELDQASEAISTAVSEIEFDIPDEDIPTLNDSVAVLQPGREAPSQPAEESAFAGLSPSSMLQTDDDLTAAEEEAEKGELLSELEVIAQDLTTPPTEMAGAATSEAALSQFETDQAPSAPLEIANEEEMMLAAETVEQPAAETGTPSDSGFQPSAMEPEEPAAVDTPDSSISAILGDTPEATETATTPPTDSTSLSDFSDSELEKLPSLIETQAATEMAESDSPAVESSGFAEDLSEQAQPEPAPSAAPPAAGSDFGSDLHAALSKRIDSLVTEAVESLNEELHAQLAKRMEDLLIKAVDQAMPALMEQLASGLRHEVQQHIQQELPQIFSNMLGQIRLGDN